ncbi:hypothetical protein AAMO2058_001175100 [Amorphochlora amoebiformis]
MISPYITLQTPFSTPTLLWASQQHLDITPPATSPASPLQSCKSAASCAPHWSHSSRLPRSLRCKTRCHDTQYDRIDPYDDRHPDRDQEAAHADQHAARTPHMPDHTHGCRRQRQYDPRPYRHSHERSSGQHFSRDRYDSRFVSVRSRFESVRSTRVWAQPVDVGNRQLPYASVIKKSLSSPKFEILTAVLVFSSIVVVAFETLSLGPEARGFLNDIEDLICGFFGVEYLARWYSRNFRPGYILKPIAIIDFLSFSPLLLRSLIGWLGVHVDLDISMDLGDFVGIGSLPEAAGDTAIGLAAGMPPMPQGRMLISEEEIFASPLIFFKLLRIFRLMRYLEDFDTFRDLEIALGLKPSEIRPYQLQLARVLLSLTSAFFFISGLIYLAENKVNPAIPNYFSAMYFGITTLTTVGFGDITPVTAQGKLVVSLAIIFGVTFIPVQLGSLAEAIIKDTAPKGSLRSNSTKEPLYMISTRECLSCRATPHRLDARFCWRCGDPIPPHPDNDNVFNITTY